MIYFFFNFAQPQIYFSLLNASFTRRNLDTRPSPKANILLETDFFTNKWI